MEIVKIDLNCLGSNIKKCNNKHDFAIFDDHHSLTLCVLTVTKNGGYSLWINKYM